MAITATFFVVELVPSRCCSSRTLSLPLAARHEERDQLDEERRECKADEKVKGCCEDDAVNVENVEVGGLEPLDDSRNHYATISSLH